MVFVEMIVVGLTGGIATGKSTVSKQLVAKGYDVIDADEITRELQAPGSIALQEIEQAFGPDVLKDDGSLNRKWLAQIIFSDVLARQRLNAIMHPKVFLEMKARIKASRADLLFLDVPLLFEIGFDQLTDINVVVYAPSDVQLERLMARDQMDEEEALAKIKSQLPIAEKIRQADFIIHNGGTLEALEVNVTQVLEKIVGGEDSGSGNNETNG